jgi:hypothetical protein
MEHVLDHPERAVARLAEQYRGTRTFPALVRALTQGHQQLEDALWSVLEGGLDGDLSPNLLWNTSFGVDTDGTGMPDGWSVYNNSAALEPVTPSAQAAGGVDGGPFLRIAWSVANTTTKGVYTNTAGRGGPAGGWSSGRWYTLSWWARASGTVVGKPMAIAWNANPNEQVAVSNPPLSPAWQRYAFAFRWTTSPLPGTSSGVIGELYVTVQSGAACLGALDFDQLQAEEAAAPTPYQPSEREQYRPALDAIGRIVGQPRDGRADDAYRIWLKARIRLNRSAGTGPDLIDTFAALTRGACRVNLNEQHPAAFALRLEGAPISASDVQPFVDVLRSAKAGGVRAILEWGHGAEADAFVLANGQVESTLAAASAAGATTVTLSSGAAFPAAAATVVVDAGTAAEIRAYATRSGNDLSLATPLASAHGAGALVVLLDEGDGKGLGDSTNSTTGGELAGAR